MRILKQLGVLLGICLLAEGLKKVIPFSFPTSVLAILILTILLLGKRIKEEQMEQVGDFFLSNMSLVFVPITVRTLEELRELKVPWIPFLCVIFISLVFTFLSAYFFTRFVQFWLEKRRKQDEANVE